MSIPSLIHYALFLLVVGLLVKPVGGYMARVFNGERTFLDPVMRPVERAIYRVARIDPEDEMNWKQYAGAFLLAGLVGTVLLYLILRLQSFLPWFFPEYHTTPLTADLSMNTAISFSTTTTWQAYGGETTMSYFSQIVGLAAQNFLAGAAGLAVGIAFIRGFSRSQTSKLGNFWVDFVRATLWVLLPISLLGSLFLIWQGVPMNFSSYTEATTLEGGSQIIAQGPIAALEFIKNVGTNGGGFFNVNGAHPFENPTALTNFVEMLGIVVLPAALTNTFGRMIREPRQGWVLLWVMVLLFGVGLLLGGWAEQSGVPAEQSAANISYLATDNRPGGNMEGKEVRFGIGGTALTAIATSNGATGSYNSMHDSYTPLGGTVPLSNMLLGEMIFGGLGTGMYSIIVVVLMSIFITGLMIGRTPEYLGKKLGPIEIKAIMLYALAAPMVVVGLTALALMTDAGRGGLTTNSGPHGLTEVLYAYTSSFTNNGQNFAGLSANSPFYNITTAVAMLGGRFILGIVALFLAGILVEKGVRRGVTNAVPTDTPLFASVIAGTAIIVGGLTYFPVLALGPLVEHVLMLSG
jgi:K+-transporting ATPase ATPase A chain